MPERIQSSVVLYWIEKMEANDIAHEKLAHFTDVLKDEQAWANGFLHGRPTIATTGLLISILLFSCNLIYSLDFTISNVSCKAFYATLTSVS